jgi:hypothetical protein
MQTIVYTVGPLAAASATNISLSQSAPSANALVLDGSLTTGYSANNIATTQSGSGAGDFTLNGSTVVDGVSFLGGRSVVIVSAGNNSGITFTVKGIGPDGVSSATETMTGTNTSRSATRTLFSKVTAVSRSGSTTGNITIGTNGKLATLDKPRRVLLTSGGADSGMTFTVNGTNWSGLPISEVIAGGASVAVYTLSDFKTVTGIWPSAATASTITVGTNAIASSPPIWLDKFALAPTALEVDASGTVNYTVQQSLNDPNVIGYGSMNWVNHPDSAFVAATATAQGNYAYIPNVTRITLNSGSGSITYSVLQASGIN